MAQPAQPGAKGAALGTLASLASLIAALGCCLPLSTLLMAAGSAGASLFAEKLRHWLLVFSVAAILFAFVQTYFRRRCEFRTRRLRTVLLWLTGALVFGMIAAPRFTASLLAGQIPAFRGTAQVADFSEAAFLRSFQDAGKHARLVVLLSPT